MTADEHEARPRITAERLVFFTDAIVAIAITLLVLPLLESIAEAAIRGEATGPWLSEHVPGLLAFFVSLVIVAATWTGHHRLFHDVAALSRPLTWLNIGWALSIVFLQLPSAMIYQLPTDRCSTSPPFWSASSCSRGCRGSSAAVLNSWNPEGPRR